MTAAAASELVFQITFHGPFHVARGEAAQGADRTVDRKNPLPASSLKGIMRAAAAGRLAVPEHLVTAVFGDPRRQSPWAWSDAELIGQQVTTAARIRMTERGVVAGGALLIGEQVWARQGEFTVSQVMLFNADERATHRLVLRAAARDITSLGGNRRRGAGWVTILDPEPWTDADSRALIAVRSLAEPNRGGEKRRAPTHLTGSATDERPVIWRYTLIAEQRVSAGVGGEIGNSRAAHSIIPGSTVRGALATGWMRAHDLDMPDQRMADLFERDLLVRQAVPDGAVFEPVSVQYCKYPDPARHSGHQPHDRVVGALTGRPPGEYPTCGSGVDGGKGWRVDDSGEVRTTRTRLTENDIADEGNLFSVHAIESRTVLRGELVIRSADETALAWLRGPRTLRLGGSRSVLGRIEWRADPVSDDAPDETGPGPGPDAPRTVVLRCRSPLIAVDDIGSPTVDLEPVLRRAFPESRPTVRACWVRTVVLGGWHMAADLPKPDEFAVAAGSVFLIDDLPPSAVSRLRLGLGLRRNEGFGEVDAHMAAAGDVPAPTAREFTAPPASEQSPRRTTEPPPPPPAAPPKAVDALEVFVAAVPADRRAAVLKGLLGVAEKMAVFTSSGMDKVARGVAGAAPRQPWARELPGAALNAMVELLATGDSGQLRDRLRAEGWS